MLANPSSSNPRLASDIEITSLVTASSLLSAWAEFLELDVAAGASAPDTADTYRRQLRLFVSWCDRADPQINLASATKDDIGSQAFLRCGLGQGADEGQPRPQREATEGKARCC